MSNEIELRGKAEIIPIKYSFEELQFMAASVADSKLYRSSGFESTEQVQALMLICEADGIHPINAVRRYHIIKGQPAMKAAAIQATFQANGGLIRDIEVDKTGASARFIHPVHSPSPGTLVSFKQEDAKAAGVFDSNANYKKYPEEMYWARCVAKGVRRVMPGIILGISSPEEIQDMEWQPATTPGILPPPAARPEKATPPTPPQPDAVRLLSQVGDRDERLYHEIVTHETAEYKGLAWRDYKIDLDINPHQVANHIRKWAGEQWPNDQPPAATDRKASSTWSQKRYAESRDEVRREIKEYLSSKLHAAIQSVPYSVPLYLDAVAEMVQGSGVSPDAVHGAMIKFVSRKNWVAVPDDLTDHEAVKDAMQTAFKVHLPEMREEIAKTVAALEVA